MNELQQRFIRARRQAIALNYQHLNDKQREAVLSTEGPLLLLAGGRQRQDHGAYQPGGQPSALWPGQRHGGDPHAHLRR